MKAFVLSGAGNRGPIEVGALIALLEKGIQPDILVGTSAGAINSLYLAARGATVDVANEMPAVWHGLSTRDVYPDNIVQVAWRLLMQKNSLYTNGGMRRLISGILPERVQTFADLQIPLYTTTVDIRSGRLFVFGAIEREQTPLVDIVMASASAPIIHPPINYHELQLVDGGIVANVAATIAMQQGATEIYLLNASHGLAAKSSARGIPEIVGYTWRTMLVQSLLNDIERAEAEDSIDLHHIHLDAFSDISFRDFSQAEQMIEAGYEITNTYLADPRAYTVAPLDSPQQLSSSDRPPGAEEFMLPPSR